MPTFTRRHTLVPLIAFALGGVLVAQQPGNQGGTKFFDDDPLMQEPATRDASDVRDWEIELFSDLLSNMFSDPGDTRRDIRALNVNTIDEVPDSGWFTNRIYSRPVSLEELRRGPNTMDGPAPGEWTVIRPKSAGFAPGFTVRDSQGEVWFITLDPAGSPNAATGAIAVACRLFWALGYYQVESYIAKLNPESLSVDPSAKTIAVHGFQRQLTMKDVQRVLDSSARNADGSYRVLAGRAVPGRPVGSFRYHGTRPDDPNDVVPHEHRRELRALKVFGAWTNLVDMKAGNTLDTVIEENGRGIVRHYLQDVGSTFGTGAQGPREWDEGHEYLFDGDAALKRLVSLGFYLKPWQTVEYKELPEIGRFEGDAFDPEAWRSRVPTAAVSRARDDDTFWAALRVAAFTDEMIRDVVRAAQYADPAAEQLLADVLIKRRDRIAQAYLPKINPLVGFAMNASGTVTFENAAVRRGVASQPERGYRGDWFVFDNSTGTSTPLGQTTGTGEQLTAPAALATTDAAIVRIDVSAVDAPQAAWATPVRVYMRRMPAGWKLVGLERTPAPLAPAP